ncbi:unnamed protein product [Prorocentrum cordatum]|uniref:Uncharacterized protein n=1 Tax=Prorocentrum cordatum TaxID=2364126 RepID=A0ABN9RAP8_9DINO|nr:unnamed protein product [Polarella glacialis]
MKRAAEDVCNRSKQQSGGWRGLGQKKRRCGQDPVAQPAISRIHTTAAGIGRRSTSEERRGSTETRAASTERKTERATPSPSPRRPAARDREPGAARHAPRRGARQSPAPILRV